MSAQPSGLRLCTKRQRSPSAEPEGIKKRKSQDNMMAANFEALVSGEYADFTLVCGNMEWQLHRIIVCPRSKFFEVALKSSFLEGTSQKVVLEDDDPSIVGKMLLYLYTLDYDQDLSSQYVKDSSDHTGDIAPVEPISHKKLLDHVRVYTLADKLDIRDLKNLAKYKFQAATSGHWPLPQFPAIVREIYTSTPSTDSGLRNIVMNICAEHIDDLLGEGSIGDNDEQAFEDLFQTQDQITWKSVMHELGDLSASLLTQMVKDRKENEFKTIKGLLRSKLGPAGFEFSALLNFISQVPRCCGAASFHLHAVRVRDSQSTQRRLRLKCTICRNVYRGF